MTEDSKDIEQKVKLVAFDPEKSVWQVWSKQFLARANLKGYKEILLGNEEVPTNEDLKDPDLSDKALADAKAIRKLNDQAYYDLSLCFSDVVNFGLVDDACTDGLPEGSAALAWKNLINKHDPVTTSNVVALKAKFSTSKLGSAKKDPDEWIAQLEVIRRKLKVMGHPISDMDMMIHVITHLPREYEGITDYLESELDKPDNKIDMADIRTRLRNKYNKLKLRYSNSTENDDSKEKALATTQPRRAFKGRCSNCGRWGHKAADCKKKEKSGDEAGTEPGKTFEITCYYCQGKGHKASECNKKKADKAEKEAEKERAANTQEPTKNKKKEAAMCVREFCGFTREKSEHLWIGDSGASSHYVGTLDGVTNIRDVNVEVEIGTGTCIRATKAGTFRGKVKQSDGSMAVLKLEVKYLPGLQNNLFSITTAIKNGASLKNEGSVIVLTKNDVDICFDRKTSGGDGPTMAAVIAPTDEEAEVAMAYREHENVGKDKKEVALAAQIRKPAIEVNKFHKLLGHVGDQKLKPTADEFAVDLKGELKKCEFCKIAKAKKNRINKEANNKSSVPMERIFIDISTFKTPSLGGKYHWVLIVDEFTGMKWSYFMKFKSDLADTIIPFLKERFDEGLEIKFIRMDNAGENQKLAERLRDHDRIRNITVEYTSPHTPQQNGVVERAFPSILGRVRAMMLSAKLDTTMKGYLWAECVNTATLLENATAKDDNGSPMHRLYKSNYKWIKNLREFGELAVLTTATGTTGKLDDRGVLAMFVGYSNTHGSDTYRFINLRTNRLMLSRDYQWLDKVYGDHNFDNLVDDDGDLELDEDSSEEENEEVVADEEFYRQRGIDPLVVEVERERNEFFERVQAREQGGGRSRVERELARLRTFYNPAPVPDPDQDEVERLLLTVVQEGSEEPTTFQEAWHHPIPEIREKWRGAIRKEFRDMLSRGVWRTKSRNAVPSGRKMIGSKWVFKMKKNGVFRARLVALGYSQIPGVDYTDNFAPVINDVTLRVLLVMCLVLGYSTQVIDVETAFLHGILEEEIYMKPPSGYTECTGEDVAGKCLLLGKSLYGLVQAARQWWKDIIAFLVEELNFTCSPVDPCLLYRTTDSGTVYLCLYVDDFLLVGDNDAITEVIQEIKAAYTVKELGPVEEYVGCTIKFMGERALITQPDLIKKLKKNFGDIINGLTSYKTPGPPGEGVVRPSGSDDLITDDEQKIFRSGVGSLLYLMKHSRPDISNAIRELSKVMDGAAPAHLKSMYRAIKFVCDTEKRGLCLNPTKETEWKLLGRSDSDYAGDKNTRQSVSGYVLYLNGALIAWRSKAQKTVTLSSTEAEYMALGDLCVEVLFVKMLLENMGFKITLPIEIEIDNTGAMFLAENSTTSQRTKHIDVRHHFVRNLIRDGIIKVGFVPTLENDADLFTKNISGDLFDKHSQKYMVDG